MYKSVNVLNSSNFIPGISKLDENNFIEMLDANNILLHKELQNKVFNKFKNKVNVQNVVTYYQIAKLFNFAELAEFALAYIQRCFTIVYENNNFLELNFTLIATIISTSELEINSELEVLCAADNWVNYDYKERSKFAKDLLLKVRLPLLSIHALHSIFRGNYSFTKIDDCVELLKEVSQSTSKYYQNKSSKFYSRRFCSQSMFNIIVSGGIKRGKFLWKLLKSVKEVDSNNFKVVKNFASMTFGRKSHTSVYCRGDLYVFGGYDQTVNTVNSIEKYSMKTNTWTHIPDVLNLRGCFCVCAFMDQIFVIGCYNVITGIYDSCIKFNTKDNEWREVAIMNESKPCAASTVFEGKVVVSGGLNNDPLNTVEAYDHIINTWSFMPNMIEGKRNHSSVANKNKLFVFGKGKQGCEVFDSTCKMFVALKEIPLVFSLEKIIRTFSIGRKLITLFSQSPKAICYDVELDEWSEELCETVGKTIDFDCILIPQLEF